MSEEEANDVQEELDAVAAQSSISLLKHLWDQQPGEPDTYYADFLLYLALGRGRSIDKAYKAKCVNMQVPKAGVYEPLPAKNVIVPAKASASFWRMASQWKWEDRAAKYDVYSLSQLVPQTVMDIFEVIGMFAKVTREALADGSVKPANWQETKGAVETLASYISPDIIQATVNHAGDAAGDGVSTASQTIIDG
jgi:hypothetical protein